MNLERAKQLEEEGKFYESANLYIDAYNNGGEDWLTVKAGELYYKANDIKKANKAYENALNSNLEMLHNKVFDFYFETKQFERASEKFEEIISNITKFKMINFADRLFNCGAFSLAQNWYSNAITETKEQNNFHFIKYNNDDFKFIKSGQVKRIEKAFLFFNFGEYKKALSILKRNNINIITKIKIAECYFMLNDFENAKKIFREIVQSSNDAYCMFMLGECYNNEDVQANSYENAFYWYLYAKDEGCIYSYYKLGLCYQFGRGTDEDINKAKEMFNKGIEQKIDEDLCFCKLGNIAYKEGDKEKAINYYKQAINNNSSMALYNVAVCYFEDKIYFCSEEEILCYLTKSVALGNGKAFEMLKKYYLANS